MHRPRIGNGLIDGCSCGFRGNSEETWAHVGGEDPGLKRDHGKRRDDIIFDRTVCPDPCGMMHTYDSQGKKLDPCAFDASRVDELQQVIDEAYREDTGLTVWHEHPELRLQERYEAWLDAREAEGK